MSEMNLTGIIKRRKTAIIMGEKNQRHFLNFFDFIFFKDKIVWREKGNFYFWMLEKFKIWIFFSNNSEDDKITSNTQPFILSLRWISIINWSAKKLEIAEHLIVLP